MKITSNGRQPQNIKIGISQEPLIGSYSNCKLKLRWPNHILQILKMKTTSNGRQHQNIKSGISQQQLIGLYSNFKVKLRWPNHILQILKRKTTSNGRWPQVEYLSKQLLDHTQILNLSMDDQTIFSKWRQLPMEDSLSCKDDLKPFGIWLMSS